MKTGAVLVGGELGVLYMGGEEVGWGSLPTPEDMATDIWPLVRSMVGAG